jgi:DUF177 domain-containing protein
VGAIAVKLRVDDITAEARDLFFVEPEQEINRILVRGRMREYHLREPIRVKVSYYRAGTEVFLTGEVSASTAASCARCAEEFIAGNRRQFRYVMAPKAVGYDKQADLCADDLEFSLYEGENIDLTPLVREQVLLALADRPLCREECKGLCPHCGSNLNESDCGCSSEARDPRLAVLRTLKVGRR